MENQMTIQPDNSELIERLKSRAAQLRKYGVNPAADILDEAATALQSLTSTIAGLEVDAERIRQERDGLWSKALLLHDNLEFVCFVLGQFNQLRPEALPDSWWCRKCGYSGPIGPDHPGCSYYACFIPGKLATEAISRARG